MKEKDIPDKELVCYCWGTLHNFDYRIAQNGDIVARGKKCFCGKVKHPPKKKVRWTKESYQGIKK